MPSVRDLLVHEASNGGRCVRVSVDDAIGLFLVANGQGSFADDAEPVALDLGIATFRDAFTQSTGTDASRLHAAMRAAHDVMRAMGREAQPLVHTTGSITACALRGDMLTIVGVGSDRAYLFRDGDLGVPAGDDTLTSAFRDGRMPAPPDLQPFRRPDGSLQDPLDLYANVLLQILGSADPPKPRVAEVRLVAGDVILLCSSGVWCGEAGPALVRELVAASAESFRRALEDASRRHGLGTGALRFAWRAG